MNSLKKIGTVFLMIIGGLTLINFANDLMGTYQIRNNKNAISRLEKAWVSCSKVVSKDERSPWFDRDARHQCRQEMFARYQEDKDNLMAACEINQVGNFLTYVESHPDGDISQRPVYYTLPLGYMAGGECLDLITGKTAQLK